MGRTPAPAKRPTPIPQPDHAATLFPLLRRFHLPIPEAEYKFHPHRKWMADFCWLPQMLMLEVDGGVWTRGRHTRGAGWLQDAEKSNAAAILGYRCLRTTPGLLGDLGTIRTIAAALGLTISV